MKIKEIDPATISIADLVNDPEGLYFIAQNEAGDSFELRQIEDILGFFRTDHIIIRIMTDEEAMEPKCETKPVKKVSYGTRGRIPLTYKYFGQDPTESIQVEFRPESGGIRISFNDKESAQTYYEYFRDQFYTRTTGASVITVSNIYKDLNLVKKDENNPDGWDKEECDDWGWYTIDSGTCRHITGVSKNRNAKRFGFTLSKPTKLYESKKREEVHAS